MCSCEKAFSITCSQSKQCVCAMIFYNRKIRARERRLCNNLAVRRMRAPIFAPTRGKRERAPAQQANYKSKCDCLLH